MQHLKENNQVGKFHAESSRKVRLKNMTLTQNTFKNVAYTRCYLKQGKAQSRDTDSSVPFQNFWLTY